MIDARLIAPRTAILGNAGSGKSTLAGLLAAARGTPVLDLDTIYWAPGPAPAPRAFDEVVADLAAFCERSEEWIIEGCYGDLIEVALTRGPLLVLLHPGEEACLDHCRRRAWEPSKYASKEEQDAALEPLLQWVREYYERDGPLSLRGHLALFESYDGPKVMLKVNPRCDGG